MYFSSLAEFLAMGTHGVYVWFAFGLFVLCFIILSITTRYRYRSYKQLINQQRTNPNQPITQQTVG